MSPRDGRSQAAVERAGRRCLLTDLAGTGLFGPQSHRNRIPVYHNPLETTTAFSTFAEIVRTSFK